ncbi:MAG TPA: hypothetical protein PKE32_02570, partial [Miltoncostaeaceae bacterium]|nr:hypothetical protein [Miltoncostaeaceae bacterium]
MNPRLLRLLCAALLVGGLLLSPLAGADPGDPPPEPVVTRSPDVDVTSAASVEFTATAAGYDIDMQWGPTSGPAAPWSLPVSDQNTHSFTFLTEGVHHVRFRTSSDDGDSEWVQASVCIDRTPPSVSMSPTGADPLPWSNTPVKVTATATDVGCASVDAIEFRTSANNGSSWDGPHPYESENDGPLITAHGTTLVEFRATDLAGNASTWQRKTVRIDTVAPTAPGARPDQIPGLMAWFDASDESSLILGGSSISAWKDVRGDGPDATQGTFANQPTRVLDAQNGHAAIKFNGNQWLTFPAQQPRTIIVAAQKEQVGDHNALVTKHDSNTGLLFGTASITGNAEAHLNGATAFGPSASQSEWQVLVGTTAADGTLSVRRNGMPGAGASGTGNAWTVDSIGNHQTSANMLAGQIGEIVMFDRVLTADERLLIEGYLADRWASNGSQDLDNGHPYRNAPPGVSGG